MDRERLERYLETGMSLAQIGALEGRHPSTIGYWLGRHGLRPSHPQHGRRTELDLQRLRELVAEGLTLVEIAARLNASPSTVRRQMGNAGLCTKGRAASRKREALAAIARGNRRFRAVCSTHGETIFQAFESGKSRCAKCNAEAVSRCRRKRKDTLAFEAGGMCAVCGFDGCLAALHFHHTDPSTKEFGIAQAGVTRSLEACREEARKCVLLCANCHAALEVGAISLPVELGADHASK